VMGYYLRGLGQDYHAYFGGAPRIFWDFPNISYFAPDVKGQDLPYPLNAQNIPVPQPDKHSVYMVIPPRRADLDLIAQRYPGGVMREFPSVRPNERLYYAYELRKP
jgi:hypothetical protein